MANEEVCITYIRVLQGTNNEQIKYMIKHRYQSHNENIAIYRILISNEMLQKQEKSCEHP